MNISVSYKDDVDKTKTILKTLIEGESRIHKEPAPLIAVSEMGVNAVNVAVRVWVKNSDYMDVNYAFLEAVKREFDSNGITIPSQQMEISLKRNNS
jgi:small conductance mechanosensitive channel